jgi:hypothetical protein
VEVTDEVKNALTSLQYIYEKPELDMITKVASDIAKLEHLIHQTQKAVIEKTTVDLAIEFVKKDF